MRPIRVAISSDRPPLPCSSLEVTEDDVVEAIQSYCAPRRGGPLGDAEIPIVDDADEAHIFSFETFFNRHDALTLAVYLRPHASTVQIPRGFF